MSAEPFTDEDLKQWKEWDESFPPEVAKLPMIAKSKSLIRRLECAEHATMSLISATGGLETLEVKQWRKSAGKFPFRSKGERG